MPLLWRYLLRNFFSIFLLCLVGWLFVPFFLKIKHITQLISTGATGKQLIIGMLCELPHYLHFMISTSAAAAGFLTMHRFSLSQELLSIRASGLSLSKIFTPFYFVGAALFFINFYLTSELVSYTKVAQKKLFSESIAINPLILLRKNLISFVKDAHIEMDMDNSAEKANNILIAYRTPTQDRLTLVLADQISYDHTYLHGEDIHLISHIPLEVDTSNDSFDHLIIDHQQEFDSPSAFFIDFGRIRHRTSGYTVLPLNKLLSSPHVIRTSSEILHRLAKALFGPILLTTGVSFGISIGRRSKSRLKIFTFGSLIFFYLSLFFVARQFPSLPQVASIFYIIPPFLLLFASYTLQKRITQGIE